VVPGVAERHTGRMSVRDLLGPGRIHLRRVAETRRANDSRGLAVSARAKRSTGRSRKGVTSRSSGSGKSTRGRLHGRVAVVSGATRGAGRGIARALAEAGATVYCTGRSVRGNPSPYRRPETIEETAEMIAAAGGSAVAVRVDHTVESEVEALFARVD